MNIRMIVACGALALLSACKSEEQAKEIERLKSENTALTQQLNSKDSTLLIFEESFSTIQQNLGLISEREKEIALNTGENLNEGDVRDEVTRDIQAINNLLQENKQTIEKLRSQLKKSGNESAGLKKLIDNLSADIQSKEEQIAYLKENLTAANFTIDVLNEMLDSTEFRNEIQEDLIAMQTSALNTAYYTVGTYKELKDNGVLEKDGTVIGLGGVKTLKDNFNKKYFAQVDITNFKTLPLNAEKVKLVTVHPEGSYTLEGEESKTLTITNPAEFWGTSKYLVVVLE